MQQLFWYADDTDFAGGVFTGPGDVFFDVFLSFLDDFFDTARVLPCRT
jgi:hypothetical protein